MTTDIAQSTTNLSAAVAAMIAGAADGLTQLLGEPASFKLSSISNEDAPPPVIPADGTGIEIVFSGMLAGSSRLVVSEADAKAIVAKLPTTEDAAAVDLQEEAAQTSLIEAIAQFSSGAALALSAALGDDVAMAPQSVVLNPGPQPDKIDLVVVTYESTIAGEPASELFWEIDHDLAQSLATQWPAATAVVPGAKTTTPVAPAAASPAPAPAPVGQPVVGGGVIDSVELEVAVELGNTALSIGELLRLGEGSVVTLAQTIGDDVVLLANGTPVASGEVVVVDDTLGFRVSGLITDTQGA